MANDIDYENDHKSKIYAYELIEMFAGALRSLNADQPVPKEWLDKLKKELRPQRTGKPRTSEVQARNRQIAKEFLERRIEVEHGDTIDQMKSIVGNIEDQYKVKNIPRIFADHKAGAVADILVDRLNQCDETEYQRKVARAKKFEESVKNGVSTQEMLNDPEISNTEIMAIMNGEKTIEVQPPALKLTDDERVRAWISDGMNRGIRRSEEYRVFYDVPEDIKAAIKGKNSF
jgi:hypothetical protein